MAKLRKKPDDQPVEPLRLSDTDESILLVLFGRELYGLDIIERVNNAARPSSKLKLGSLYAALTRLENNGLVSSRWGDEVQDGTRGARRKYYKITGLGERSLNAMQQYRLSLCPQGGMGLAGG